MPQSKLNSRSSMSIIKMQWDTYKAIKKRHSNDALLEVGDLSKLAVLPQL